MKESVMLYGLQDDSRYIPIDFWDGGVYVSSAYAEKYLLKPGDEITLYEEYGTDAHTFRVDGVYHYEGGLKMCIRDRIMAVGMNFHPVYLSTKTWMWIVGIYIAIASCLLYTSYAADRRTGRPPRSSYGKNQRIPHRGLQC